MKKSEAPTVIEDVQMAPKAHPRRLDAELQVMAKIDRLLTEVPGESLFRVLCWLAHRQGYKLELVAEKPVEIMDPCV